MLAVETIKLSKDYETKDTFLRAVDTLDLAIEESEIYSLLGPNGAGKTTSVRLLAGFWMLQTSISKLKMLRR